MKDITFNLLLFICILIIGFFIGAFSTNKMGENDKYKLQEEIKKECIDIMLPAYEKGFVNALVKNMDNFILNCTPFNVEAFSWTDVESRPRGVVMRCPRNNTYLPVEYIK